MSELPQSIPPDPVDSDVSFVREVALLHLPEPWRTTARAFGVWAFDASMERWGIAPETTNTEDMTAARIDAVIGDLRCVAGYLTGLAAEEGQSVMGGVEIALCKLSGRFGRQVEQIASELKVSTEAVLDSGGG